MQNNYRIKPYEIANLNRLNPHDYLTKPIETYQIKMIIKKFKDKSPGQSQITKSILENVPNEMLNIFKDLLNLSLSMGYYPQYFKIALMHFIPKQNKDNTQAMNYRPISLLEVTGKIFERILCDRLNKFLESNNLMNENQYGFRAGRGTQLAIASLYEKIAISQKKRYQCNVICRDVKKAFDKVWLEGLQYKIMQINLPDILEKILCQFITNREAKIKINKLIGPSMKLESGVPQGSILSPTLYIFYTADAPLPSPGCYSINFADDNTQVVTYPGKSKRMLAKKTEREIKKLNEYERQWKIQTNKNKFQIAAISSTKPYDIVVDNRLIPFKRSITVLGLNLTPRGISKQISNRTAMARAQLRRLKRFRKMTTKTQIHLYKAFIRPLLEYPTIPLCTASKTGMQRMQRVQSIALRRAAKIRPRQENSTNMDIHRRYQMEPINIRLFNQTAKIWQKLEAQEHNLTGQAVELNRGHPKDHSWWPTIGSYMRGGPPEPRYL